MYVNYVSACACGGQKRAFRFSETGVIGVCELPLVLGIEPGTTVQEQVLVTATSFLQLLIFIF